MQTQAFLDELNVYSIIETGEPVWTLCDDDPYPCIAKLHEEEEIPVVIEPAYYLTGNINDWNNTDTSYKLTNDGQSPEANPIYTCRIPANGNNDIEFLMTPESGLGGDWSKCLSATKTNEAGRFVYYNYNEGRNLVITAVDGAIYYDLTFNMLEQTWSYIAVLGQQWKDGDIFTAKTIEGVDMMFYVFSAEEKTCMVYYDGKSETPAIDTSTTGTVTIPSEVEGFTVTDIGWSAFQGCQFVKKFVIPESVEYIGGDAFFNCSWLSAIYIPKNVSWIGRNLFPGCWSLERIEVDADNPYYESPNGCNVIIDKTQKEVVAGCNTSIIPNGVNSIGIWALWGCTGMTSITLPPSVTTIGDGAFGYCHSLESIVIPSSVSTIDRYAFWDCYSLSKVVSYIAEPFEISETVFLYNNYYESVFSDATLYVPAGTKEKYEATSAWNQFKIVEMEDEVSIKDVQVEGNRSIQKDSLYYDLSGRVIKEPVKGQMYIHNGRKFIQK
ncbi:MAG: leucine-rich repeat protein [Bacteroidaceae bacterium]|nr:leucine-rich repeat protein [Bacteroidaceae bacterium]MBR1669006.1 leucine-rich repeat protein [Bacteroidaceae bacterium]